MATTVKDLERWVEAGLIDPETADAIETYEGRLSEGQGVGRGIEAIAYLGSALILIAVSLLAVEFWDEIEPWGRFALAAGVTTVLVVVGSLLGRSDVPAVDRAQTFAWFLAALGVALTATIATADLAELDNQDSFLVVAGVFFAAAILLWLLRSSILQLVAMGLGAYATVIALVSRSETAPDWVFGLSFAGVGLVWLLLTWTGVLSPIKTSYAVGGIGLLLISFPEAQEMPWPLLGLLAGLALMAVSVALKENVLLGLGVLGLFIYIPMTIFELFGETVGVPFALLITGLVLLGVVLATVRLRKETE
ncbi:MAG: DUF2157 domain-containing protein [Acidimicrobiia bacterium]|jgi:uncharacterized membrane protein